MKKLQKIGLVAVTALSAMGSAFAVPAIENDTLEGLPDLGSDLGGFMQNLAPGVGAFLLIMGVFLGIVGIIGGIAYVIVNFVKKMKTR